MAISVILILSGLVLAPNFWVMQLQQQLVASANLGFPLKTGVFRLWGTKFGVFSILNILK